jgi:hypothetical protein
MQNLNQALGDISSIRRQMARASEFRGYGPATLALTGVFAMVAAVGQGVWLAHPSVYIIHYLKIWFWTAALSGIVIAVQTWNRSQRIHSGMAGEMLGMAVEQFLPAAAAGALLTIVLIRATPELAWILPGLWQIVYSLGVFASCRFLPRHMRFAGAWYLGTGLLCVALGNGRALSPWAMGIPFGAGQMLVAAILYRSAKEAGDEG